MALARERSALVGLLLLLSTTAVLGRVQVTHAAPSQQTPVMVTDATPTVAESAHVAALLAPRPLVEAIDSLVTAEDATPTLPPVDDPAHLPASIATAYASAVQPVIEPPARVPDGAIELPAAIATAYATFGATATPTPRPTKTPTPTM